MRGLKATMDRLGIKTDVLGEDRRHPCALPVEDNVRASDVATLLA